MLNSLDKNQLYISISISFVLFITLNFILGSTTVFGLAEFVQSKTGYFFGVGINTLDHFLISLIPLLGLLIRNDAKEAENRIEEIGVENK